jgi:hypothetical protein
MKVAQGKLAGGSEFQFPHLYVGTMESACRVALGLNAMCVEPPNTVMAQKGAQQMMGRLFILEP